MQRTHRGVALDTVFDENSTCRGTKLKLKFKILFLTVMVNVMANLNVTVQHDGKMSTTKLKK